MTPAPLDMSERLDRLRLIRSENVGPITFRQLLIRFGSAAHALEAIPSLANKGGRKHRLRIASRAEAQSELDALSRIGGQMVHWGQPDYPAALAATEDAPPVLSVLGHLHLLTKPCIGIVGSRNASTNGKRLAQQFSKALGEAGYCVISGLASGIDAAAHFGSLSSGTIAAVAGGVDVIYPRENTDLYHQIVDQGAIVAELPVGTVGQARHFPRRNRIISGMASAVLVVEATQRSGSLITAQLAADQGREVFAIPGSPLDPRARGANDLIRKGAALIETPEEMIGILNNMPSPQLDAPSNPEFLPGSGPLPKEEELLRARALVDQALSPTSVAIDDLIADLNLAPALVAMVILELELAGLAERHPGNRISRLAPEPSSTESNNEKPTKKPASLQKQADLF
jgi:DNA processing protein